jgi:hypothetical protein
MKEERSTYAAPADTFAQFDTHEPKPALAASSNGHGRGPTELVVISNGTRLSQDQQRVSGDLLALYESLAGAEPGQYWPQALLDSAGHSNRPNFPRRGSD